MRGDSAPRGTGASTADMNYVIGVKPVGPPPEGEDLSRLASLHPGAERGAQGDAILNGLKPGTGPGCTSAEGPAGAAGEPGVVCHCNPSGIPYESSTARLTTNDSSERTASDSSARASTGQHTPPSHTGIGAGSGNTALPQRPATTAPSATLSSQLTAQFASTANMANAAVAPSPQLVSADSFPYRRRTLRDLESMTATLSPGCVEVHLDLR